MNMLMGILGMFWLSLHVTASVLNMIFMFVVMGAVWAGAALWAIPAVCLALLVLDWSGRIQLSGLPGKLLAALALPALGGLIDVMARDELVDSTLPVWGCMLSLLGLAGYMLLWEEWKEDSLDKAVSLLEQGSGLTIIEAVWLYSIGGMALLLLVFGSVITLLLGALFASKNSLLDYAGVWGILLGFLALHLLQSVLFCRGACLARKIAPALDSGVPLIVLFVPVWNQIQSQRLIGRLQAYRLRQGRDQVWAEL